MSTPVIIVGAFDNLRSRDVRFIQEASKLGPVTALVYPDQTISEQMGHEPRLPLTERLYMLRALRFVTTALPMDSPAPASALPQVKRWESSLWVDQSGPFSEDRRNFCEAHGIEYHLLAESKLQGFPELPPPLQRGGRKKVVVTGCFDWLHSGHVRFFEEVHGYGDLYVIVGHDANIRLLKGQGHPLLPQEERCYMVSSIRYVTQGLISSGEGWMDADPEIQKINPDIYAVNEDGDRGGKRQYCAERGIQYLVLQRTPAAGLLPRSSTELRGF
jgi:cytidyltransferase-like protein